MIPLLFVLGFAAVFTAYGAAFGAAGALLVTHQGTIINAAAPQPITFASSASASSSFKASSHPHRGTLQCKREPPPTSSERRLR